MKGYFIGCKIYLTFGQKYFVKRELKLVVKYSFITYVCSRIIHEKIDLLQITGNFYLCLGNEIQQRFFTFYEKTTDLWAFEEKGPICLLYNLVDLLNVDEWHFAFSKNCKWWPAGVVAEHAFCMPGVPGSIPDQVDNFSIIF